MIFGICLTKITPNVKRYYNNFIAGIFANKCNYVYITNNNDLKAYAKKVDCYVMYGWYKKLPKTKFLIFRRNIHEQTKLLKKQLIVIDTGFVDNYYALGLNGIKGLASYNNRNSPSDRFKQLNLEIKPWKTEGKVLVLGQQATNTLCPGIDIYAWHKKICNQLLTLTNRPIHFRRHPRKREIELIYFNRRNIPVTYRTPLKDDLKDCYAVISLTSNALFECLVEGVHIFPLHRNSYFYEIGNNDIALLEKPTIFDRRQFLYNTAYAQWTLKEINEGIALKHLMSCVKP